MLKIRQIIILGTLGLSIIGCGVEQNIKQESDPLTSTEDSNDSIPSTYEIENIVYSNKKISITYPQLIHLGDQNLQNRVNELIKSEALMDVVQDENLDLDLNHRITLKNEDILSIEYSGLGYYTGATHPIHWFFTTMVNLKSGDRLRLPELLRIDDDFVELLKKSTYITSSDPELIEVIDDYIKSLDTNDLKTYLNQADLKNDLENPASVYSYLTEDAIVVSLGVPHPIGGHAEFKINLNDLKGHITHHELWKIV